MSIPPIVKVTAIPLALTAGALGLIGILYDVGVRPSWFEHSLLNWMITSDGLAQRAYDELLNGRQEEALALFELALRRDPASPYRWCDYGELLLSKGEKGRASRALRRGVELGPYVAPIRMRAVNFAYRTGNQAWALEQGKELLSMTDSYDDAVFQVWHRMEIPADAIFRSGIPDGRAARAHMRYLMDHGNPSGAENVWALLLAKRLVDDALADDYVGALVRYHEYSTAVAAWKAYAGTREPGYPDQNAIFNGSFEREPIGHIFDWRIDPLSGVNIERDTSVAVAGHYSLRMEFDDTDNLAFSQVSQRVVVAPGEWDCEAWMRTDGITTDQGVRLRIFDAEAPTRLDVATETLTGTHGWTALAISFAVPTATRLVEIRLVRNPTWKFDRRIQGTVWMDGLILRPRAPRAR